jgi:hypothetical protein
MLDMKHTLFLLMLILSVLAACKKDNLDPPSATLSGTVVINGASKVPVGVRSNGVQLELWQRGYQLFQKIPVYINQDGTFSAKLFNGKYKLVRLSGAPWSNNTDSIDIDLNGTATVEVPVTPFFTIGGEAITFNKADTSITGVFTIAQMVAGRTVGKLSLNIGLTGFVDATNQIPFNPASTNDVNPPADYLTAPSTIKVYLNPARYPDVPGVSKAELRRQLSVALQKGYAYARVGVQTSGVTERLYTQVKEISLK